MNIKFILFAILEMALVSSDVKCQNNFREFLYVRTALDIFDKLPVKDREFISPFLKYANIDLGVNNYKKNIYLLKYYYDNSDFKNSKKQLTLAVSQGLTFDSIPKNILKDNRVFNHSAYTFNRELYIKNINMNAYQLMKNLIVKDQEVRIKNTSNKVLLLTDSLNQIKFKDIVNKFGLPIEDKFDLDNNIENPCWQLFSLIGHWKRKDVIQYRNIALQMANKNDASYDYAVLLENYLLTRQYFLPKNKNLPHFSLDNIYLVNDEYIDFDKSLFQLYTLGKVVLSGRANFEIVLFPANKLKGYSDKRKLEILQSIKSKLIEFGAIPQNIKVDLSYKCESTEIYNVYVGYYSKKITGGVMQWFPPYRLISF
jgi:hypothetical protein